VQICGSVGWFFRDVLHEAAEGLGIHIGQIEKSPMEGLVKFHYKD